VAARLPGCTPSVACLTAAVVAAISAPEQSALVTNTESRRRCANQLVRTVHSSSCRNLIGRQRSQKTPWIGYYSCLAVKQTRDWANSLLHQLHESCRTGGSIPNVLLLARHASPNHRSVAERDERELVGGAAEDLDDVRVDLSGSEGAAGGDVGEAHEGVHQGKLSGMVEFQARNAPPGRGNSICLKPACGHRAGWQPRVRVDKAAPSVMWDLERTCACCNKEGVCAKDLAERPDDPVWKSYCPNAFTLDTLLKLKARS
jgi:hypothetical protein